MLITTSERIIATPKGIFGASVPKNEQWLHWWLVNRDRIKQSEPCIHFVVDAIPKLYKFYAAMGAALRDNPNTGIPGWKPDSFKPVHEVAREGLAWFTTNKPHLEESTPFWLTAMYDALEGAFLMNVRLADECEKALKHGFVAVRFKDGVATNQIPEQATEISG